MNKTTWIPVILQTIFTIISVHQLFVNCKVFTECELLKEFKQLGLSQKDLANWVCLAKVEGQLDTRFISRQEVRDGSLNFGLFQISNRYWCTDSIFRTNECKIHCRNLVDDDISDDVKCAKVIQGIHGFDAWYKWKQRCQGEDVRSLIKHC